MVRDAVQRSSDRRQITQHAPQRAGATDVWLGNDGVYATREAVVRCIRSLLGYTTTSYADGDRSIFVGPPDRWIFVGYSLETRLEARRTLIPTLLIHSAIVFHSSRRR